MVFYSQGAFLHQNSSPPSLVTTAGGRPLQMARAWCCWFFLLENTCRGFFGPWFLLQPDWTHYQDGASPYLWSCFPSSWKAGPLWARPRSLSAALSSGINALARPLWVFVAQTLWFLVLRVIVPTGRIHNELWMFPNNQSAPPLPSWADTTLFSLTQPAHREQVENSIYSSVTCNNMFIHKGQNLWICLAYLPSSQIISN